MSTVTIRLSQDDVQRIADAVLAKLQRDQPRGWLTVKAASQYTSLSEEALRTAYKRGRLSGHKGESGRLAFTVKNLDNFMRSPD